MKFQSDSAPSDKKIQELVELESEKKKELEKKKAELEKKKKELEELEKTGEKEISATRKRIRETVEELQDEERRKFEESEEKRRKKEQESTLEGKVGGDEQSSAQAGNSQAMRGYGDAVNEVLRGSPNFYDVTNYNVINKLEGIAGDARNRPLTSDEKAFIEIVEYHAKSMVNDEYYKDKQGATYLKKELAQIDFINKMAKKNQQMGSGDYAR